MRKERGRGGGWHWARGKKQRARKWVLYTLRWPSGKTKRADGRPRPQPSRVRYDEAKGGPVCVPTTECNRPPSFGSVRRESEAEGEASDSPVGKLRHGVIATRRFRYVYRWEARLIAEGKRGTETGLSCCACSLLYDAAESNGTSSCRVAHILDGGKDDTELAELIHEQASVSRLAHQATA